METEERLRAVSLQKLEEFNDLKIMAKDKNLRKELVREFREQEKAYVEPVCSAVVPKKRDFTCFCFTCGRQKPPKENISEQTEDVHLQKPNPNLECKTIEDFYTQTQLATQACESATTMASTIIKKYSYVNDPNPDFEGLTILGSYMWLLTYAVQGIVDENSLDRKDVLPQAVAEISLTFQDICQGVERFLEMADSLHMYVHKLRTATIQVTRRSMKKWNLSNFDPFKIHPERKVSKPRPRRRISGGLDQDDEELLLQVQCPHLTVMVQTSVSTWTVYSDIRPNEKIIIFNKFMQQALFMVEAQVEELALVSNALTSIEVGEDLRASCNDLVSTIMQFTRSPKEQHGVSSEEDEGKSKKSLEDLWESVDKLHDEVHSLLVLAQESRDICRTCYVHLDQFYKWHLPSYDLFMSGQKKTNPTSRQSGQFGMKELWGKFTSQDQRNATSLHFLSLMDFHSSIYQAVLTKHSIECDRMYMKVVADVPEPEESWGLVPGAIDKRKLKKRVS